MDYEALRLLEDYGIKYVLTMVWHKPGGFEAFGLPLVHRRTRRTFSEAGRVL